MAISYNRYASSQTEHIVCESSRLRSTYMGGGHIYDLKLHEARDNGTVVAIDALSTTATNNPDVQVFKSKDALVGAPVYLVLQVPFTYESGKIYNEEKWFYNESGDVVRAYELFTDDIFTISANGITAASTKPVVGQYVYFDNTTNKWVESASYPASAGSYICICQITEEVNHFNPSAAAQGVSYRLRVVNLGLTVASQG